MRRLIIQRTGGLCGCLKSQKLYVSCADGEEKIGSAGVKLLGRLKNGKTSVFEIEEAAVWIYAPYRRKGRVEFDAFPIPAGKCDLYLSGKMNTEHLRSVFRFDGHSRRVPSGIPQVLLLSAAVLLILISVTAFLHGNAETAPKPKSFVSGYGEILLDETYREIESERALAAYTSGDSYVYFLAQPIGEGETAAECAKSAAETLGGRYYETGKLKVVYTEEGENRKFFCMYSFYDTASGVKTVKFLCNAGEKENREVWFLTSAAGVKWN